MFGVSPLTQKLCLSFYLLECLKSSLGSNSQKATLERVCSVSLCADKQAYANDPCLITSLLAQNTRVARSSSQKSSIFSGVEFPKFRPLLTMSGCSLHGSKSIYQPFMSGCFLASSKYWVCLSCSRNPQNLTIFSGIDQLLSKTQCGRCMFCFSVARKPSSGSRMFFSVLKIQQKMLMLMSAFSSCVSPRSN